jgi:outer membrane protein assembly factor BamD
MAAYSYYSQNYYGDAMAELTRFLRVYPNHKDIVYAEYFIRDCVTTNKLLMRRKIFNL